MASPLRTRVTITTTIAGTRTTATEVIYFRTTGANGAPHSFSTSFIGVDNPGGRLLSSSSSVVDNLAPPNPSPSISLTSTRSTAGTSTSQATPPAKPSEQMSDGLSTGAKAGIGERKRRKAQQKDSPVDGLGKNQPLGRGTSARSQVLPTWKGELSADSARAELDGTEKDRVELDGGRVQAELNNQTAPTEMDGSTPEVVQARQIQELAHDNGESRTAQELEHADAPSMPPPIPYASKPRPG